MLGGGFRVRVKSQGTDDVKLQKGRRSTDGDGGHRYLLCKNPLRILNWYFLQEPGQAIIRKWLAGTKAVVAHKWVFGMVI